MQASEKKIEERGLVLEGLVQHYHLVSESAKMKELMDLLDNLDFNQVCDHVYVWQVVVDGTCMDVGPNCEHVDCMPSYVRTQPVMWQ